jgi:hypothetical protein
MIYKKVTIWFKANANALEFDTSVYENNYNKVAITVSGDYLIISAHDEDMVEVTTEVYHLSLIKCWKSYMN